MILKNHSRFHVPTIAQPSLERLLEESKQTVGTLKLSICTDVGNSAFSGETSGFSEVAEGEKFLRAFV